MDLTTFGTVETAEQGAVMNVVNPVTGAELVVDKGDGKTENVWIKLASADSERVKKVERAVTNKRLAGARQGRQNVTAESLESDEFKKLMAATIAWGNVGLGQGPLELNDANARTVYTQLPWLREQAQAFMAERGNYSKSSPAA
jgi:hypothetical protein